MGLGKFGLALSLALLVACQSAPLVSESPEEAPRDWRERLVFAPVERAEAAAVLDLPAEVVLPPCAVREIGPPLPGRIARWHVRAGDSVTRESPLADVVSTELADLDAMERELQKVVRDRRRVLAAQRGHVQAGMQSVQSVYEAELALSEAEARLSAVRRQLEARKELGADPKKGDMGWQWRSPVEGIVREQVCAVGSMQGPEAHCLTILDTTKAEVRVAVPERFLPRVGELPTLHWLPAWFSGEEEGLPMQLARRDPMIDTQSRTQAHYFTPVEPTAPRWRGALFAGGTGRGTLVTPAAPHVLRVPRLAVVRMDDGPVVFVQRGTEAPPEALSVRVVGRFEGDPLVESPELSVGDSVVARGAFLLKSMRLLASE